MESFLRKTLQRIVFRDDGHRLVISADVEKSQQIANVVFIVELRADSHRLTLHRQQILGLRHHYSQVIEFKERRKIPLRTHKALHSVIQPIRLQLRTSGYPCGGFANLGWGSE